MTPLPKIETTRGPDALRFPVEQFAGRWSEFNDSTGAYDAVPWKLLLDMASTLNLIVDRLNALDAAPSVGLATTAVEALASGAVFSYDITFRGPSVGSSETAE